MSFVTIRKYLDAPQDMLSGGAEKDLDWARFVAQLIRGLKDFLAPSNEMSARARLEDLETRLPKLETPTDLQTWNGEFHQILRGIAEAGAKQESDRQGDLAGLFTLLNDAMMFAATNAERATGFTTNLESSLRKASRIQDIRSLHSQLSEMMTLVREEARHQNEVGTKQFAAFEKKARIARKAIPQFQQYFGTREEAVGAIESALTQTGSPALPPTERWYSGVFIVERLRVIRQRYGDEVAAELVEDLLQKLIRPLAAGGKVFHWTPEAILLLFTHGGDRAGVKAELSSKVTGTFSHRAQLGTRSATLSVDLRWVAMPLEGAPSEFIWSTDRFVEGA